jgi:uncharacterized membrane protein
MAVDLKLIIGLVIIALAFIYTPVIKDTIVRSALGQVLLLVPGYGLTSALFPGKADIDGIERAALSFGLSVAVYPLIEIGLNYTPLEIRLDSIAACLTIFTLACVLIANKRRHDLPAEARFTVDFADIYRRFQGEVFASDKQLLDKALTMLVIVSILLSVAMLAYLVAAPKQGEKFSELYILGPTGKADQYPTTFDMGDSKFVNVGIVNHEYRNVTYDLVVLLSDGISVTDIHAEKLTLSDNQTWEKPVELKPDRAGTNMNMQFLLYADGNMTSPYRECNLWVNVTNPLQAMAQAGSQTGDNSVITLQ